MGLGPYRLVKLDELKSGAHFYIRPTDECYALCEYHSGMPYNYSDENDMIFNIKKDLNKPQKQIYWKDKHIERACEVLQRDASPFLSSIAGSASIIPIPPSKRRDNPLYDDRVLRMANTCAKGTHLNVVDAMETYNELGPSHYAGGSRPKPPELMESIWFNELLIPSIGNTIVILDDVITAGAHFRACESVLLDRMPGKRIIGLFLARAVGQCRATADDYDDFPDFDDLL